MVSSKRGRRASVVTAEKERGKIKDSDLDTPGVTDIFLRMVLSNRVLAVVFLFAYQGLVIDNEGPIYYLMHVVMWFSFCFIYQLYRTRQSLSVYSRGMGLVGRKSRTDLSPDIELRLKKCA